MPATRREHPYIWATWLPRLLTGENSCEWAVWFKAHYARLDPPAFRLRPGPVAARPHRPAQRANRANWEVGGYDVDVEAQNRFELRGRMATLAGRPDIIARP